MSMKTYQAYASAFLAEGTETLFGLMGDGNMLWMAEMATRGVETIQARHEGAALAMADGYARATGTVGVATVTCGPGVTQIMTSLVVCARQHTPLVIFAGDSPLHSAFYLQEIDQTALARAAGVRQVTATNPDNAADDVRLAFHLARSQSCPVLFNAPMDVQEMTYDWPWSYQPQQEVASDSRIHPDPEAVERVADRIAAAERPLFIAGRGAVVSGAGPAIERLADRSGALLATSLLGKGLFGDNPRSLGLAGAFTEPFARASFAEADLVVGVGARLGHFTSEGGYLYPNATVVSIDSDPQAYKEGLWAFEEVVRGDARATVEAIEKVLEGRAGTTTAVAAHDLPTAPPPDPRSRQALESDDWSMELDGDRAVDPEKACAVIDRVVPAPWSVVVGIGHFWNFVVPAMTGRPPERYTFNSEFGVIGQGLPCAAGVATARGPDDRTVLIEGDGSLLMNLQELETVGRHRLPLLIMVLNDGAYGAEVHKLAAKGRPEMADMAVYGRPDLGAVAAAFGLSSVRAERPSDLVAAIDAFDRDPQPTLVDIPIAREVSREYRRIHFGEHDLGTSGQDAQMSVEETG